jgi:hypothetical protein
MGFSLDRRLTYFGDSPRCLSSYSPRAKVEVDLINVTQISIQTKPPLSWSNVGPVFLRRLFQSFDYVPEILIVDCCLLIACMSLLRSVLCSRHEISIARGRVSGENPPFEAKIRDVFPAKADQSGSMNADLDKIIAGSSLMAKLQKCHQCCDRELLDYPLNAKESFPSCRYGHPWLFAIGATPVQRSIIQNGPFCNRRFIWSSAIWAVALHNQHLNCSAIPRSELFPPYAFKALITKERHYLAFHMVVLTMFALTTTQKLPEQVSPLQVLYKIENLEGFAKRRHASIEIRHGIACGYKRIHPKLNMLTKYYFLMSSS